MRGIDMQEEKEIFSCPVEATLSLIGGKYKPLILWHLIEQPLHYMELQRLIPKATAKMLSQQLRDLQQSGLVSSFALPLDCNMASPGGILRSRLTLVFLLWP